MCYLQGPELGTNWETFPSHLVATTRLAHYHYTTEQQDCRSVDKGGRSCTPELHLSAVMMKVWTGDKNYIRVNCEVLAVPPLFLQESGHSGGILVESSGMEFSRKLC